MTRASVTIALLLAGAVPARPQSLGDAARREQEKKRPASPAPSYTQDDLKKKRPGSKGTVSELPATGGAPRPDASPSPEPSAEPETDRGRLEREWRARFAQARARIADADARAYEDRIETVFVHGIPVQQRVRVRVETPELVAARQALSDLEEELRVSGGLPGWGRE
jgi:hypothetical protein